MFPSHYSSGLFTRLQLPALGSSANLTQILSILYDGGGSFLIGCVGSGKFFAVRGGGSDKFFVTCGSGSDSFNIVCDGIVSFFFFIRFLSLLSSSCSFSLGSLSVDMATRSVSSLVCLTTLLFRPGDLVLFLLSAPDLIHVDGALSHVLNSLGVIRKVRGRVAKSPWSHQKISDSVKAVDVSIGVFGGVAGIAPEGHSATVRSFDGTRWKVGRKSRNLITAARFVATASLGGLVKSRREVLVNFGRGNSRRSIVSLDTMGWQGRTVLGRVGLLGRCACLDGSWLNRFRLLNR